MSIEEIISRLKKYELKYKDQIKRTDFVSNEGTVLDWNEIQLMVETIENQAKEIEELKAVKNAFKRVMEQSQRNWGNSELSLKKERRENTQLKERVKELEAEKQKDFAIQQFIGYSETKAGYGLNGLVNSMGLTLSEWKQVKKEVENFLSDDDINEIEKLLTK